ncbi:GroES-like protein, partial [Aureobasidium melanogenum]
NAGFHPLICVAGGSGASVVQPLIDSSKGDVVLDYREGADKLIDNMKAALGEHELHHAFDCVSEKGSSANICRVLQRGGQISLVLPLGVQEVPPGFEVSTTMAGNLWPGFKNKSDTHGAMGLAGGTEFGYCYSRLLGYWFSEGKLRVHRPEVVEGGLLGVEKALKGLREGKNHGVNDKMTEYTKMKNAELEALLKERNLPHTGKKADLVKRLQEHDAQTADGPAAPAKNEDEIDWDDEPAASKATTDAAASALAAGGQGQPPNPQAVPNQQADIDPSQTDDLTVIKPAEDASTAQPADATAPSEAQPEEPAKPAVDFTSGLAKTTLDQEIEKRKARAKKFGLNEDEDEALKALERAKRFGNTEMPGKLNEALPERRERKRGAPADGEQQGASKKRENNDNKRGGRRDGRRGGGGAQTQAKAPAPASAAPAKKEKPQMSEADRAKAEARKARFAAPSSS